MEFEKRKIPLVYVTQDIDDPAFNQGFKYITSKFIGDGNKGFAYLNTLNACIVVSTTPGLGVYQWRRSKTVSWYVHIPHMVSDISVYRMFGLNHYDSVLLTGDVQKSQEYEVEMAMNTSHKELKVVGCPYLDDMYKRNITQKSGSVDNKKIVVLVAPSWGKSSLLNVYGSKLIDALLNTGFSIVIRPHPQSLISEQKMISDLRLRYKDLIEWNFDRDNFNCLKNSSIMITDFSGVIFDYVLTFNKPVIYSEPKKFDKAPYNAAWLKKDLWVFEVLPKLGLQISDSDFVDLKPKILSLLKNQDFIKNIEDIRRECWYDRGNGAKNVVDYLEAKYKELGVENV